MQLGVIADDRACTPLPPQNLHGGRGPLASMATVAHSAACWATRSGRGGGRLSAWAVRSGQSRRLLLGASSRAGRRRRVPARSGPLAPRGRRNVSPLFARSGELLDCGHCVTSPNKTRRMNASRFSPGRRSSSVQLRSEMVRWASKYSAFSAGASSRQRRRCSTVSR
jgi:hypothetical protein